MGGDKTNPLSDFLGRFAGQSFASGLTDAQLLERFAGQGDEAAFELLVWRHGAMVMNLCRRVLRHEQDVEDAFQATFLTFIRKAHSIRRRKALASWLYKVAYRVALAARERSSKIVEREKTGAEELAVATEQASGDDIRPVIDEEVNRLPERYRLPVVLCYLEGLSNEEAARQLGCPAGTIFSRLSRAREMLRKRLVQRGLVVSSGVVTTIISANTSHAALPRAVVVAAIRSALEYAAGNAAAAGASARVVSLAEGVMKAMFLSKCKPIAALLVAAVLLTAGVLGYHVSTAAPPGDGDQNQPPRPPRLVAQNDQNRRPKLLLVNPKPGGLDITTRQPASVEAFQKVEMFPRVSGFLKQQKVDIGDRVKKGQVLAEIDAPELALDVQQASIRLKAAEADLNTSKALVKVAEAEFEAAKSALVQRKAEKDIAKSSYEYRRKQYKRFEELRALKSIDARLVDEEFDRKQTAHAALDTAKAAVLAAEANVEIEKAKITKAKADLMSRAVSVRSAELKLAKVHLKENFTKVRAPIDGVVTQRNFNVGALVTGANQPGMRPLLILQRTDKMRLIVQIPDRDIPFANVGDPVEFTIPALGKNKLWKAKISRLAFAADEKTRTMRVEIDVPNTDGILHPGMLGDATILLQRGAPNSLTVPSSCVVPGPAVYLMVNGKPRKIVVRTGTDDGNRVTILSGLKADDEVVANPQALKKSGK